MSRVCLLLCLTAFLACSPAISRATEMTFISVSVESVGRDGRAHKTVTADGSMSGGHMSGDMPPRIYRSEGRMPEQELVQLNELIRRIDTTPFPDKPEGTASSSSYRKLSITRKDKADLSFVASGETRFEPQLLEQIYTLLAAQKVGGW